MSAKVLEKINLIYYCICNDKLKYCDSKQTLNKMKT